MKLKHFVGITSVIGLLAMPAVAQDATQVEQLKQQLEQLKQELTRQQEQHRQQLEALGKQIDALQKNQSAASAEQQQLKEQLAAGGAPVKTDAIKNELPPVEKAWSPAAPIRIGSGGTYLDLSLVGTFTVGTSTASDIEGGLQPGGHDPTHRGFTVQGVEATFTGNVDPYLRGQANIAFLLNQGGETSVELEEAYLETTSMPGNLQLRGGQFFTDFGRLNATHPHTWGFVDSPLVNARLLGPDGLRNPGARLSWLVPTPFFSEVSFGVQDSAGETATSFRSGGFDGPYNLPFAFRDFNNDRGVRHLQDMLFSARYATSFELTDSQTLLAGVSAALGPNASGAGAQSTDTQIYGADVLWKWKSPNQHGGFPFVSWQTEAMLRKYRAGAFNWDTAGNGGDADGNGSVDAGTLVDPLTGAPAVLGAETLTDYGFYSQVLYGFRKDWVAGLRFDWVDGNRGQYQQRSLLIADGSGGGTAAGPDFYRTRRWRVSPNLTWYPSEFSKIRLQYNYDDRASIGADHSVWLQFEFLLGAHAAHKF